MARLRSQQTAALQLQLLLLMSSYCQAEMRCANIHWLSAWRLLLSVNFCASETWRARANLHECAPPALKLLMYGVWSSIRKWCEIGQGRQQSKAQHSSTLICVIAFWSSLAWFEGRHDTLDSTAIMVMM